jgi:hypothetical protein
MNENLEAEASDILKEAMGHVNWSKMERTAETHAGEASSEQQWDVSVMLCVEQRDPVVARKGLVALAGSKSNEAVDLFRKTVRQAVQPLVQNKLISHQWAADWIRNADCLKLCHDGILKFDQKSGQFSFTEKTSTWLQVPANRDQLKALQLPKDGLALGFSDADL